MTKEEIFSQILQKHSYLCIGLDTDLRKIPTHLHSAKDPVFEFNKQIIDATADFCVAYKPNTAFYEAMGPSGWETLQKTFEYIPDSFFKIADAKRGDIGNTSQLYAKAFFEHMHADAITVAPYMGQDSVSPFLAFDNKWVILLALTSNPGSSDFQMSRLQTQEYLFEKVISVSSQWADTSKLMYVVGATKAEQFKHIRNLIPEHFLLVPGVGAQGGDLQLLTQYGMNKQCGLLVNASRAIIYASDGKDFALHAAQEAKRMAQEMAIYLDKYL
jgi:orotidine-5'-phosphate decarboxylase